VLETGGRGKDPHLPRRARPKQMDLRVVLVGWSEAGGSRDGERERWRGVNVGVERRAPATATGVGNPGRRLSEGREISLRRSRS
jgi:hypothetical protein